MITVDNLRDFSLTTVLAALLGGTIGYLSFDGLDNHFKSKTNKSFPFWEKHRETPFIINNVRELFNSAGDLKAINKGYTHILEGTEIIETANGKEKEAHFSYYIEEDGGFLWCDRVSEKTYVDSFSPPTPP